MKKSIFDARLYRDGMKQLRVGGLVAALVLGLQAVLLPVGKMVNGDITMVNGAYMTAGYFQIIPLNLLLFTVIAPLMALYLFRFLSQRNASDFYHSIPQTRICLYISFVSSVLCWALLLQIGATILACLVHMLFPFRIVWSQIAVYSLQMFACVLFVVGAVMLAVALTGNMLTNLAVSLLIIFFPRLLMLVVKLCIGNNLVIVESAEAYLPFLGNRWNVVTGTVFSFFGESANLFGSLRAGAYTAGIGVIYLFLGGVMFCRRKSEAAGQASIDPKLQLVFRLLPAAVLCMIPNAQMYEVLTGSETASAGMFYQICVFYLIGVIIYFLYELVSTRKTANLKRAVPGVLLLAGFNLLMIFGMLGMRRSLLSFSPAAEDIEYVQFSDQKSYVWDGEEGERLIPGYLGTRVSRLKLNDQEILELVAARLQETVKYSDTPISMREEESESYIRKQVVIRSRGRSHGRTIRLLRTDANRLAQALKQNPDMQKIYMELPPADDPSVKLSFSDVGRVQIMGEADDGTVSAENCRRIYLALLEDVSDMGFEKWYAYCTDAVNEGYDSFGTLYMRVEDPELGVTGSAFPIGEKTPKALSVSQQVLWESQANSREEILETLNDIRENREEEKVNVNISYCDTSVIVHDRSSAENPQSFFVDMDRKDAVEALIALVKHQKDVPVNPEKGYLELYCYLEYYMDENAGGNSITVQTVDVSDYRMFSGTLILALPDDWDYTPLGGKMG